jgi:hypothetical protein
LKYIVQLHITCLCIFWYNKNLFWRGKFSKDDRLSAKVKNVERNAIPIEKKNRKSHFNWR